VIYSIALCQQIGDAAKLNNFEKVSVSTSTSNSGGANSEANSISAESIIKQYTTVDKSGDLNVTVPLYVVKGRSLKLPIQLIYQAGVQVDQKSTEVGLGWSVNFGKISRDYGAFEPDYSSTLSECKMQNTESGIPDGLIDSKDNCSNCNFNPVNPMNHEKSLVYNLIESASTAQLTPDDYVVSIPGKGGNTFWNNGTTGGTHNFVWEYQEPWKIEFSTKVFEIPQEFSRINEINLGTNIAPLNINNSQSFAAAIAIPPYVSNREFGKYVHSLYDNLTPFPDQNTSLNVRYEDFDSFTITLEDGTKYIFGKPLRGQKYLFSEASYWSTFHRVSGFFPGESLHEYGAGEWWKMDYIAEWLLTEVLSYDYVDLNQNNLADDGDLGDWIRISYETPSISDQYLGFLSSHQVSNFRTWSNFSQTDRPSSLMKEVAYISQIETPIEKLDFTTSQKFDVDHDYFKRPANYLGNLYYIWDNIAFQGTTTINDAFKIEFPIETKKYDQINIKSAFSNIAKSTILFKYAAKGSTNELAVSNYLIIDNNNQENWITRASQNTQNLNYHYFNYSDPTKKACFLDIINSSTGRGKTTLLGVDIFPEDDLSSSEKKSYKFEYNNNPSLSYIHSMEIFKKLFQPSVRQSFLTSRRPFPNVPGQDPNLPIPYNYGNNFYDFLSEFSYSTNLECSPPYSASISNHYKSDLGFLANNQSAWSLTKLTIPDGGEFEFEYENDSYNPNDNNNFTLTELPPIKIYNIFAKGRTTIQNSENVGSDIKFPLYREFYKSFDGSSGIRLHKIKVNSLHADASGDTSPGEILYTYGMGHYSALPSTYWQNMLIAFSNFIADEIKRHTSAMNYNYRVTSCGTEYFNQSPYEKDNLSFVYDIRVDNSVKNSHHYETITEQYSDGSTIAYYYNDPTYPTSINIPYSEQKIIPLKGFEQNNSFSKVFAIIENKNLNQEPVLTKVVRGSGLTATHIKKYSYDFTSFFYKYISSSIFDFADLFHITPFYQDNSWIPPNNQYVLCDFHDYTQNQSDINSLFYSVGWLNATTYKSKQTTWKRLIAEEEIINGQTFEKRYSYSNSSHKQITKIEWNDINTDPSDPYKDYVYSKKIKYPLDYNIPSSISNLDPFTLSILKMQNEYHLVNIPVEEYTYIHRKELVYPGDPEYTNPDPEPGPEPIIIEKDFVVSGNLNLFKESTNNTISKNKHFQLGVIQPFLLTSFQPSTINQTTGDFDFDINYYQLTEVVKYDKFGNPLTIKRKNGITTSVLFDNTGIFEQMNCKNANSLSIVGSYGNEVSYIGFESGPINNLGAQENEDLWIYNPNSEVIEDAVVNAHSGKYCQKIFPNITGINYSASKEFIPENSEQLYKFSAWVKTALGFSNGNAVLVLDIKKFDSNTQLLVNIGANNQGYFSKSIDVSNDWHYFELNVNLVEFRQNQISLGNLSTSDVLGFTCYIVNYDANSEIYVDDLRLQPALSQMVTTTYDQDKLLVTSVSDLNSRPKYISYDNWGREYIITDYIKNILSVNNYHQKNIDDILDIGYHSKTIFTNPYLLQDYINGSIPDDDMQTVINYFDGFGKTVQSVEKQFSAKYIQDAKDKVTIHTFNKVGFPDRYYLPFISSTSDGTFKTNALNDLLSFYNQPGTEIPNDIPYFENEYELGGNRRILKGAKFGSAWQLGTGNESEYQYGVADQSDLYVFYNSIFDHKNGGEIIFCDQSSHYQLPLKTVYIDQDNNKTIEFTDYEGRLLWKRSEVLSDINGSNHAVTFDFTNGGNGNDLVLYPNLTTESSNILAWGDYSTRYVYDYSKRLVAIIPPEVVKNLKNANVSNPCKSNIELVLNNSTLHPNAFVYNYDEKGRIIEFQNGLEGLIYNVYDYLDNVILTQNPEQRSLDQWNFYKYDALGRVIQYGLHYSISTRQDLQNQVNNQINRSWENITYSNGSKGYTNQVIPVLTLADEILVETYYDDYDFDMGSSPTIHTNGSAISLSVNGQLTGKKVKILDGNNNYLVNIKYFDDKSRLVQEHDQHLLDGWDVYESDLNFDGSIANFYRTHYQGTNSLFIRNTYDYDHYGRLTDEWQQTANDPRELHMVFHEYNELGQEITKSLHYDWLYGIPVYGYLQNIDFRYNINGWLTHINNSSLIQDSYNIHADFDVFGQELQYESPNLISQSYYAKPFFNGNISVNKWKTKHPTIDASEIIECAYIYRYDNLNRMTAGYFATTDKNDQLNFDYRVNDFTERVAYDPSGNIVSLKRWKEGSLVDDLEYRYNMSGNNLRNNKLYQVNDKISTVDTKYFNELVQDPDEYIYDNNSRIIQDLNKGTRTAYNSLNLPNQIQTVNGVLDFIYDGEGKKLSMLTSAGDQQYYINGIEYNTEASLPIITSILTSEGRVRPKHPDAALDADIKWVYDYLIKDHLGSVRAVVSEESFHKLYWATMEEQNASLEEALFYNVEETRENNPLNKPPDSTYSIDEKVSLLNAWLGRPIGHAKLLEVYEGDEISFSTKYFFENIIGDTNNIRSINDILNQLAGIFFINSSGGIAGTTIESQQLWANNTFLQNGSLLSFLTNSLGIDSTGQTSGKNAFLTYLMLDKNFKFIPENSGVIRADNPDILDEIGVINMQIRNNGFIYIYVSNESSNDVAFDNFRIINYNGYLREINTYYPYGLVNPYLSYTNSYMTPKNESKFQSKKLIGEFDLDELDFHARMYDPIIGRWRIIDPKQSQRTNLTPYNFCGDNPINRIDPDGQLDGEHEIIRDKNGKIVKNKLNTMGDDDCIDYVHHKEGDHKGQTEIVNTKTNDRQWMETSEFVDGYTHRPEATWRDISLEFFKGTGPEKSLMYGADQNMNRDIRFSSSFAKAHRQYRAQGVENKFYFPGTFGIDGFTTAQNMNQHMMGRVSFSFYPVGDKVVVMGTDSKSKSSLYYNSDVTNTPRINGIGFPKSTTHQTYLFVLPLK